MSESWSRIRAVSGIEQPEPVERPGRETRPDPRQRRRDHDHERREREDPSGKPNPNREPRRWPSASGWVGRPGSVPVVR
jgi:hypothetical protein